MTGTLIRIAWYAQRMPDVPAYVDRIEAELTEKGRDRMERGAIGWRVEKDYQFRVQDEQADARGARTGDVYRTTDPNMSLDYVGTHFYLDLDGDPLDVMDHRYGMWFDIVKGMPRVEVHTDLTLYDPDPLYAAVEDVLEEHDLPIVFPGNDDTLTGSTTG